MNIDDVIDAKYTDGSALALREETQSPPALFGTDDPVAIIERAVRVADALKAVVVSKNLISNIQGKQYPQVEAWLTLAAMLRLTTVCEWSRRVDNGWEARVFVRDANGSTIGAAEAQCLATERSKKTWEDYALRSMAQTRATSKALRSVLGFVMVLAGYVATPAEEMPGDTTPPPPPPELSPTQRVIDRAKALGIDDLRAWATERGVEWRVSALGAGLHALEADLVRDASEAQETPVYATPAQRRMAMALHAEAGHDDARRHDFYDAKYGVRSFNDLTMAQATEVIDYLKFVVTGNKL